MFIKSRFFSLGLILSCLFFFSQSYAQGTSAAPKVGVVDVQYAILHTNEGMVAKQKIEKDVEQQKKTLSDQQIQLKKMETDFQAQQALLSDADKAAKQKEFQTKLQQFQNSQMNVDQNIRQKELSATQEIYQNLMKVIQKISKQKEFDLVFDKGAGVLLYSKNITDVTNEAVQAYNNEYKLSNKKGNK